MNSHIREHKSIPAKYPELKAGEETAYHSIIVDPMKITTMTTNISELVNRTRDWMKIEECSIVSNNVILRRSKNIMT